MALARRAAPRKGGKLRILAIGAHPDDCELKCSGVAALWARQGHTVRFVSATNGGTGHHRIGGVELVQRRMAEAKAAADVLGVESQVLPIMNGGLVPSLEYRSMFIRLIRDFNADVVITHRPNDYHPDHRYTSVLVQDSSYVVTVPNNCPESPAPRHAPSVLYMADEFAKPTPFQPDFVAAIDSVMDKKISAIVCHESQMFEWIPWNSGMDEKQVPKSRAGRRKFAMDRYGERSAETADRFRPQLVAKYGQKRGSAVKYAEAFERCEYGGRLSPGLEKKLFGAI
jgi:LmbE family N-acetylglucosaminyl deacetylase